MKTFVDKVIIEPLQEFGRQLVAFLPNLLSGIVVFAVGLVLAWIVKMAVVRIVRLLKLDKAFARAGVPETLEKIAVRDTPAKLVGRMVYWLIVFVFFFLALRVMKVPEIDRLLERLLLYIPSIFVALIILIFGCLLGNFAARAALIAAVNAGLKSSGRISQAVRALILVFAVVMAFEQLGIGQETMIRAFTIAFGGIVLALALAFGLGGRDQARDFLEKKLKKGQPEAGPPDDLKHL